MKKLFVLTLAIALVIAFVPTANAGVVKDKVENLGENITTTAARPLDILAEIGTTGKDTLKEIKICKPWTIVTKPIFALPAREGRVLRRGTGNLITDAARIIPATVCVKIEPTPLDEDGEINQTIAKGGEVAEVAADTIFNGVIGAVFQHNRVKAFGVGKPHKVERALMVGAGATIGANLVDKADPGK